MATPVNVLVCSGIPGLCAAVQRAVDRTGICIVLQQRSPTELEPGGAHHDDWNTAKVAPDERGAGNTKQLCT